MGSPALYVGTKAFTVAENIILGSELTKNGMLDIAGASKESRLFLNVMA